MSESLSIETRVIRAARLVIEEYDDPIEGTEGASETEFHDRIEALRSALAECPPERVGPAWGPDHPSYDEMGQ
jgi:hypothetical protein